MIAIIDYDAIHLSVTLKNRLKLGFSFSDY